MHREGDWHAALHIWVGGIGSDGEAFVLLQRRSRTKDLWPGAFDVAVGGHLRAGESLAEAVREAEEEIGLAVGIGDLIRLGRRFAARTDGVDNEVQEVFGLRSDLPLSSYRPHPEEVDAVLAVPLLDALALFDGDTVAVAGVELERDAATPSAVTVTVAGFAAGEVRGYASRALRSLRDVIAGREPVPFELRRPRLTPSGSSA